MLAFLTENWLLVAAALISGAMLAAPKLRGGVGGGISPAEAVRLINREKAVVIDVREADEYAKGHIKGARHVPLASLDGAKALPTNKALPLVVVCARGARAGRGAAQLRKMGYEQAQVLAGGMGAWQQADLPVQTA